MLMYWDPLYFVYCLRRFCWDFGRRCALKLPTRRHSNAPRR